jgi:hypothetical protein
MATSLKTLEAQVAELTALVTILATQGASVTVTETKPAKKSRKKKAKAPKAWNYYAIGKVAKVALRNDLKDLLRETCEDDGDFVGWTWKELVACADDQGVDYSHLIG